MSTIIIILFDRWYNLDLVYFIDLPNSHSQQVTKQGFEPALLQLVRNRYYFEQTSDFIYIYIFFVCVCVCVCKNQKMEILFLGCLTDLIGVS